MWRRGHFWKEVDVPYRLLITQCVPYLFLTESETSERLTGNPMVDVDPMGNPLYPSAPALAAGGLAVGGAALTLGGAVAVDAFLPSAAAGLNATVTIADVTAALPEGMTAADFGRLAGFSQGLTNSSAASVAATPEVIANLQASGVTREAVHLAQRFYAGIAKANPANLSAVQRSALLSSTIKGY